MGVEVEERVVSSEIGKKTVTYHAFIRNFPNGMKL